MGQGRVELPTSRLSGVRSNHLSYWPRISESIAFADRDDLGPSKLSPITSALVRAWLHSERSRRFPTSRGFDLRCSTRETEWKLLRKEVIQPQVPLRLPCYDFTPVTDHSLGTCLPCGLAQPLLEQSTPMV